MSNYHDHKNKLSARLEELKRKHKELDDHIEEEYSNLTVNNKVRILKTQKLWFKDEIHRIETELRNCNG